MCAHVRVASDHLLRQKDGAFGKHARGKHDAVLVWEHLVLPKQSVTAHCCGAATRWPVLHTQHCAKTKTLAKTRLKGKALALVHIKPSCGEWRVETDWGNVRQTTCVLSAAHTWPPRGAVRHAAIERSAPITIKRSAT